MPRLRLNWNEAVALEGINNYRLFCNDSIISNTSALEYIMENVLYNFQYVFYVVGVSNNGRISPKSNILTIILTDTGTIEDVLNYNLNFDL